MRHTLTFRSLALAGLLAPAALIPAHATAANADVSAGDWLIRGGLTHVAPKSDNGTLGNLPGNPSADVGSNTRPSGNITYMMTDNLGLELLVAIPFKHDLNVGGADIGSTRHLPPTLSLQYHFNTGSAVRPYVGAGINYTYFFDEPDGLDLDDSWGAAVQAGIDFAVDDNWFVNAEVRWIDIDTDVSADGVGHIGTVNIDPWTFGMNVGYRF
ncbi:MULTISPECIES: OmpW family protein [unclassified Thioalkalivibrio]|uniref:OmpW/AlkL family protein n=1 Tax=unclassified Thioalkalivibrio TaxID=2621013 RepID=UPI00035D6BA2|nr:MULTISPECIES: OmpW family outer membrane protein [unclassified Thioalkalivibrio]